MKVLPIAKLTAKEVLKEKLFIGVVIVSAIFCVLSYYLSNISAGNNVKIAMDFILSFQFFITAIFAIFMVSGSFHKDLNDKVIYLLYSKPMTKVEYLTGKVAGFFSVLTLLSFILFLINTSAILIINKISNLYVPHIILTERAFIFSLLLTFMGLLLISVVTLFSVSFSSSTLAMLVSFLVFIIGLELSPVKELVTASKLVSEVNKIIVKVVYYVFPNFSLFDVKTIVVYHFLKFSPFFVSGVIVYSVIYSIFLILISLLVFERKEL